MAEAEKELVSSPRRKILRFCLVSLIVVVCVYVTLYASVLMLAARKEADIKQRLKDLVPNVEQLANQRASVEENETARMMREWAENKQNFDTHTISRSLTTESFHLAIQMFLNELPAQRARYILPFEPFIDDQQIYLEHLHSQVDQAPPISQMQFDEPGVINGVNQLYSRGLGLLTLDILVKIKRDQPGAAFRSFKTAWIITEAYRMHLPLSSRSIAFHYQSFLVQILRELPSPSSDWRERISVFNYREEWKYIQVVDLWQFLQATREKSGCYSRFIPELLLGKQGQYFADLIWPFFRLCAVTTAEIHLGELEQVWFHHTQPCWGAKSRSIETMKNLPLWNTWHEQRYFYNPFGLVTRLEFETECTRVILHLKELQQKSPAGKLPITLPKMESKVCPGEYWEYQPQPDGTVTLKFSQPIESAEFKF